MTLTWNAPDDDSVTGYQILRRRPHEGEKTLLVYVEDTGSTETTWTDRDVTIGTQHVYRMKAINAAGSEPGVPSTPERLLLLHRRTVRPRARRRSRARPGWAKR